MMMMMIIIIIIIINGTCLLNYDSEPSLVILRFLYAFRQRENLP